MYDFWVLALLGAALVPAKLIIRAVHCLYYSHSHTMHGRLMDTGDCILSVYSMSLSSNSMVQVAIQPYYGQREYNYVQN